MAETAALAAPGTPGEKRLLRALILGGLAPGLNTTIVAISLQRMALALHTSVGTIQWVSTGYILALAAAIPVTGWVQARLGGRRAWRLAQGLFLVASLLCAAAWNGGSLIGFRLLHGAAAGLIFPLMQTLALLAAPPGAGAGVIATISLAQALGPIFGPVLGGTILNWLDWRWLFLLNLPFCAASLLAFRRASRALPAGWAPPAAGGARLDRVGLALLPPGLAGLLVGLSTVYRAGGMARADVLGPTLAGAVLLGAFALWATRRGTAALVDVRLLRARSVAASSATLFLAGFCMYSAMFLLPLYLQNLRGLDVLHTALLLVPQGIGSLLSRTVTARLTDRFGAKPVTLVAFLLTALATVPFALLGPGASEGLLAALLLVRGLALGALLIPPFTAAYVGLDRDQVPHATMITRIALQLGGAFGTAVTATVLLALMAGWSPAIAYRGAFWASAGFTALAAVPALYLPRRTRRGEAR